jgi:hypothetical protein
MDSDARRALDARYEALMADKREAQTEPPAPSDDYTPTLDVIRP